MAKTVIILGAGASFECGAPLMKDFLDVARDVRAVLSQTSTIEAFDRVFRAISGLQRVHSKVGLDLFNIEAVYTTFEIAALLGKLPGIEDDLVADLPRDLERLIVTTLDATTEFELEEHYEDFYLATHTSYRRFDELVQALRGVRGRPGETTSAVSVITFNYDVAADVALACSGLGPDYSLPNQRPLDDHEPVRLLKLHGSLNWGQTEDDRIIPLHLDQDVRTALAEHSSIARPQAMLVGQSLPRLFPKYMGTSVRNLPVIVPPMLGKTARSEGLAPVWSQAAKELAEAERIYVMGYSLPETDTFFPRLLALGLEGDTVLSEFVVFDPNPDVKKRYEDILGAQAISRFEWGRLTFNQACGSLADEVEQKGILGGRIWANRGSG